MPGQPNRQAGGEINHHCSVVELNGVGVLVEGASGSGKTSLALGLVERAANQGLTASFVSDDQVLLRAAENHLVARVPPAIAGKVEVRGFGIDTIEYKAETTIGLIARLVEDAHVERLPAPRHRQLLAIDLPELLLPRRHEEQAARIVLAWLKVNQPAPAD